MTSYKATPSIHPGTDIPGIFGMLPTCYSFIINSQTDSEMKFHFVVMI